MSGDWRPTGQRIPSLEPDQWSDEVRQLLNPSPRPLHILTTLAHHPTLLAAFLPFAASLTLRGRLPRRDAEILSLRAAWNCGSDFEWGHHRLYALAAGLGEAEVADVAKPADAGAWAPNERALLDAADELHRDRSLGDTTWKALAAHYDEAQCIEVIFTVGQYTTLSTVTNALRIPLEPDLPGLPAK
ncbi:MAG: carboxymuconolactone decarboxylase family protein [Myxococcota bacterium]